MSIVTETYSGVHLEMPAATYHAMDALNASRLNWLAKSPRYCKWKIENPAEPSDSMALGTAVHAAVLQPKVFASQFVESPECDRRTKEGKIRWQEFTDGMRADCTLLSSKEKAIADRMRESVISHPLARKILEARTATELSAFWADEETGLACKLRADACCDELGILVDLKTTRSIDPDDFASSIWNFGYWRQIPYYLHGMAEVEKFYDSVAIIAVESTEPYECAVFELDGEDLDRGWQSCRALMNQYAKCRESGLWPSRSEDRAATIKLPRWTLSKE